MGSRMYLSLTEDLRAFVDRQSGDGTLYSTPGEYVRSLIREAKDRLEAAHIRDAIRNGYEDVLHGRTVAYRGNLRKLLNEPAE